MATRSKPGKREITRQKVIQAAIECIQNEGFHAANTNRIAQAAGVSWGVLQYHFGDKDGLLQAVLDSIFENFTTTLSQAQLDGQNLQERLNQLIDVVWALVSAGEYRVSVAILRNAGRDSASTIDGRQQLNQWAIEMSTLWDFLLGEDIGKTPMSDTARHLLFATLRGLADEINPGRVATEKSWQAERIALSAAIAYLLGQG
jgi:AcrR family transcriptional regulator